MKGYTHQQSFKDSEEKMLKIAEKLPWFLGCLVSS